MGTATFTDRGRLKKRLNNRLRHDGYWPAYNELRAHLKASGVPESDAWRVAAYKFPPKDGSVAEIVADPKYSEIAANWNNGAYSTPESTGDVGTAQSMTAAESGQPDPHSWKADWERLAAEVGPRTADEIVEVRWVLANYLADIKKLRAEDVPSAASLSILMWTQMSPSHFGDFLRTHNSKLLPDKKTLEYEARFKDDGRDLKLLEEFEIAFAQEGKTKLRGTYLALDAAKRESVKRVLINLQEANGLLSGAGLFGTDVRLEIDTAQHCANNFPVSEICQLLPQWDLEQPAEAAEAASEV